MTKKLITKTAIKEATDSAIKRWENDNTPASIEESVYRKLNAQRDSMIAKLAGFENRYNDWGIDHCNGRISNISTFIKENSQVMVTKWLTEQMGSLPVLNKQQIAELKKEYTSHLAYGVKEELRKLATERAKVVARDIFESSHPLLKIETEE